MYSHGIEFGQFEIIFTLTTFSWFVVIKVCYISYNRFN
jgi:hypothetical protein